MQTIYEKMETRTYYYARYGIPTLLKEWNRSPLMGRREQAKRTLRLQHGNHSNRGKGNKAWKRVDAMDKADQNSTVCLEEMI